MNTIQLFRNVRNAGLHHIDLISFLGQLFWPYSHKIPKWFFPKENVIRFYYPEPIGDLTLKVRSNTRINSSDRSIFIEVFHNQFYNLGLSRAPETILDLGANAGFTAVYFHKCFPKAQIACVEPIPNNIKSLRVNLALNHVHAQVFPAAIAIEDGSVLMEIGEQDYAHKIVPSSASSKGIVKTLSVPALTVPTICKKLGWDQIDLLKVDIEGYESILFSINCPWLKQVNALCIEWHDRSERECLLHLAKKYGFNEPHLLRDDLWLLDRPAF